MDTMGPLGQARSTMDIGHFMVPLGQARPIMDTLGSLRQAMPTMMMIYRHQHV